MENSEFIIYPTTSALPLDWNIIAASNKFLQSDYLEVLQESQPKNMTCFFVGIFSNKQLVAVALMQLLDVKKLESFGERDSCFKKKLRDFIFKQFATNVLFVGNNMVTGQNGYAKIDTVTDDFVFNALQKVVIKLKNNFLKQGVKIPIVAFKDFADKEQITSAKKILSNFYAFKVQPNMVFEINTNWLSEKDYVASLSKKYRDQYKRARKKSDGILKVQLNLKDIIKYQTELFDLYKNVANNAPFNTFYLAANHFKILKQKLGKDFMLYGYFRNEKLVGFNTLIANGDKLDTYFLGYDTNQQKANMLYLNMLYDMVGYAIKNKFKKIEFARTALEIKSSVGAKPQEMYGFINHSNTLIQNKIGWIFKKLEPETIWKERNPFAEIVK